MFSRWWFRAKLYFRSHAIEVTSLLLIFVFLIIYFAQSIFYSIPAGSVGVLWERFGGGTVTNRTLGEGFHVIMPWNKIYIYSTRVQLRSLTIDALSVDGLDLKINLAYQFELDPKDIPILHQFVGPDYGAVMMDPTVAAVARNVFSANTPEEIYSQRRTQIQLQIQAAVDDLLLVHFNPPDKPNTRFVRVENILMRSIKLPPAVASAINSKNQEQQRTQEYDYRILREAKEAQRKRIEAGGIRDFQDIVSRGITESYLRWSGIQATLELAKSPNAKVVVIGGGKDGMPLILGGDQGTTSPGVAVATPEPAPWPTPTPTPALSPLGILQQRLGLPAASPKPK